jgi:hypothetical protein
MLVLAEPSLSGSAMRRIACRRQRGRNDRTNGDEQENPMKEIVDGAPDVQAVPGGTR